MELAGKKLGLTPTTVRDIAQATQEGKSAENVNVFTQIMKTLSSLVGPREGEFNTGTGVQPEGMHPHQKELLLQRQMQEAREEAKKKSELGITDLLYRNNTLRDASSDDLIRTTGGGGRKGFLGLGGKYPTWEHTLDPKTGITTVNTEGYGTQRYKTVTDPDTGLMWKERIPAPLPLRSYSGEGWGP